MKELGGALERDIAALAADARRAWPAPVPVPVPELTREPLDCVDGWLQLGAGYFLGDCFVEMYDPDALTVSHGEAAVAADDSGRSFFPDHTACMPLPVLQAILRQHGLAIVPATELEDLRKQVADAEVLYDAADLPSARAVLADVVRIVADWIDDGDEQDADASMQEIEILTAAHGLTAELARRAAKEPEISAHGIPDGENDPGWPDGTPEHVRRAGKAPS